MPKIIKDGAIVDDQWLIIDLDEDPTTTDTGANNILVPLAVWQAQREALVSREDVGVYITEKDEVETLKEDCLSLAVIGIEFNAFTDGRGFSAAYLLRERFGFKGELRALGTFIRDQLCYLSRCGFNAFALQDENLEEAKASLGDLQEYYQASANQPRPLFRRR